MSYSLKLILSAGQKESLTTLINSITTADPALLVQPTADNFVTTEEKYAELNIAVPTAGVVAAEAAARATFIAALNSLQTLFAGNPLGEGVEGVGLEGLVQTALAAVGMPTGVKAIAGQTVPPTGVLNTSAGYGTVEVEISDFVGLLVATLQLARARTILVPCLAANHL